MKQTKHPLCRLFLPVLAFLFTGLGVQAQSHLKREEPIVTTCDDCTVYRYDSANVSYAAFRRKLRTARTQAICKDDLCPILDGRKYVFVAGYGMIRVDKISMRKHARNASGMRASFASMPHY